MVWAVTVARTRHFSNIFIEAYLIQPYNYSPSKTIHFVLDNYFAIPFEAQSSGWFHESSSEPDMWVTRSSNRDCDIDKLNGAKGYY